MTTLSRALWPATGFSTELSARHYCRRRVPKRFTTNAPQNLYRIRVHNVFSTVVVFCAQSITNDRRMYFKTITAMIIVDERSIAIA
jgi:Leu/Phe-tRNA-protein transferase